MVTGYRDCCQLAPVLVKSVGGYAEDARAEPCAKAGERQDIVHLTETRLIPLAEFGIKKPLDRCLVSRRELPDGDLTHAPRLTARWHARTHTCRSGLRCAGCRQRACSVGAFCTSGEEPDRQFCVASSRPGYQDSTVSSFIFNVTFDCAEPRSIARFWSEATGYTLVEERDDFARLNAPDQRGLRHILFFRPVGI
jgi:Glyoxalase-like domain